VTRDTVEERILALQTRKCVIIEAALGMADHATSVSGEEFLLLLNCLGAISHANEAACLAKLKTQHHHSDCLRLMYEGGPAEWSRSLRCGYRLFCWDDPLSPKETPDFPTLLSVPLPLLTVGPLSLNPLGVDRNGGSFHERHL
jgi:hypothetical protein